MADIWSSVKERMKLEISKPSYSTWIEGTIAEVTDDILTVYCDSAFQRDWLETNYKDSILHILKEISGQTYELLFEVTSNDGAISSSEDSGNTKVIQQPSFEPPTEHYDKRIEVIDEQICSLIKQRKDLSNNNPGFPTKQFISAWSKKYNLYEEFLHSVFGIFFNEESYKPVIEPKGFLKNIPILKSFEKDDLFYSVTFIRQFENASVVHLAIDSDDSAELPGEFPEYTFFDLSIEDGGAEYDCRNGSGGGFGGHTLYTFIVTPPLPDDISGLELVFKEYKTSNNTKPTGLEFVIKMDN